MGKKPGPNTFSRALVGKDIAKRQAGFEKAAKRQLAKDAAKPPPDAKGKRNG